MADAVRPINRRRAGVFGVFTLLLAVVSLTATSAAAADLDDNAFVRSSYEGLLGRQPEAAGLGYWTGQLDDGQSRSYVLARIGDSLEYRQRIVSEAYRDLLAREPDPAGLAFWSSRIIDRLTEAGLRAEILASDEFFRRAGSSDEGYLTDLYRRILGREPDPGGRAFWLARLRDGRPRREVARAFLSSPESIDRSPLSVAGTQPAPGSRTGTIDELVVRLDRPIDAESSALILSVDGERVPGAVGSVADQNDVVRFVLSRRPVVDVGAPVSAVVTVFAFDGDAVVHTAFDFTYRPDSTSIPPGDDLMVAYYGHPTAPVLGVGGEGTPEEALGRLLEQAAPYEASGKTVVPTFEMIATLVTASPGDDGFYRARTDEAALANHLRVIRRVGGRLVLDIQPGRADVLDEARAHEALLLEPDVGLALDPEWVVGPTQTPKGRIGTLDAADINRVSSYLSQLVEANRLPPKILIIHRFRADMITNPDAIASPPGVRIIFQADGEGGPAAKIGDYDTLLPLRFERGIKIFYDEDVNRLTPAQVLARLDPMPVYVSYQ